MDKIILWLILLIVVTVLFPFLTIWSLNTLFSLAIPFNIETWAAVILLGMFIKGNGVSLNK